MANRVRVLPVVEHLIVEIDCPHYDGRVTIIIDENSKVVSVRHGIQ